MIRHAKATRCQVSLALKNGRRQSLVIEIDDDGIGLPQPLQAGVGLYSMQERAEELGGILTVTGGQDGGTHICAELPLPNQEAE